MKQRVNDLNTLTSKETEIAMRACWSKYDKFTSRQRVDIAYENLVHNVCYWDLSSKYNIHYNTIRDIVYKMKHFAGSDFKHLRMYSDINNPLVKAMH